MLIIRETIQKQELLTSPIRRLLSIAVADSQFQKMLLNNPAKAIENGYGGEQFILSTTEKSEILAVGCTTSLTEFVQRLLTPQSIINQHQRDKVS